MGDACPRCQAAEAIAQELTDARRELVEMRMERDRLRERVHGAELAVLERTGQRYEHVTEAPAMLSHEEMAGVPHRCSFCLKGRLFFVNPRAAICMTCVVTAFKCHGIDLPRALAASRVTP